MASVRLVAVALDCVDSGDRIDLPSWFDWAWSDGLDEVRQRTASGSDRSLLLPGHDRSCDLSSEYCPVDVAAWVSDHLGAVLCVRTPDGEKMFGRYVALGRGWQKVPGGFYDVSIRIQSVSHSEAV